MPAKYKQNDKKSFLTLIYEISAELFVNWV